MISTFRLKFGRGPGIAPALIPATPVTVFVGPNNSGKSKVLREIEYFCRKGNNLEPALILEELEFMGLSPDKVTQAIEHLKQSPNPGELQHIDHIIVESRYHRIQVHPGSMAQ
jgi:ABC-type cobalamin/Fe3+-siderophores transport system ATPase subunit